MSQAYLDFLKRKIPQAEVCGFEPNSESHESLKPHQRDIGYWAMRGGRRAVFANFGLGKTRINLQVAKWVTEQNGRYLIVAPLGVRAEFINCDGPAMGAKVQYVTCDSEIKSADRDTIIITNYERVRDGGITVEQFAGVGLDEASVLRSFGSKTYQTFLSMFKAVPYRFVFTATPSPNRYKELIHYAGYLGIMDTGEALTRFFQRDSSQAGNLTLYPHMEKQFWFWLHSWAVFLQKPSDLGYSDEGYNLPPLKVHWHKLDVDHKKAWSQTDSWGQAQLIREDAQGLKEGAAIKRESIDLRVAKAKEIIAHEPLGKHWIIWHDLEDERRAIEQTFPIRGICKTIYGSQELELREDIIAEFKAGLLRMLGAKPSLAGSGTNLQWHCADAIFLGVGYKLNDFLQSIHRIYRYLQKRGVNIHIIYLESESSIKEELEQKWRNHDALMARMSEILKTHKLSNATVMELMRSMGCERAEVKCRP